MKVIVVGAGLAGLTCAKVLAEGGAEVVVLEASDGVGGRVRTDEKDGFLLDRGMVGTVTVTGGADTPEQQELAETGGPSLVLPAGLLLLLLGSGLLGWAALRRTS